MLITENNIILEFTNLMSTMELKLYSENEKKFREIQGGMSI